MSQRSTNQEEDTNGSSSSSYDMSHRNKSSYTNSSNETHFTIDHDQFNTDFDDDSEIEEITHFVENEDSDIRQMNDRNTYPGWSEWYNANYADSYLYDEYSSDTDSFTIEDINEFIEDLVNYEDNYHGDSDLLEYASEHTFDDEDDIVFLGNETNNSQTDLNALEESIIELGQRVRTIRFAEDELGIMPAPVNNKLTASELRRLEVHQYGKKYTDTNKECLVCFTKFVKKAIVMVLKCNHVFHRECIEPWFRKDRRCPLCRQDVIN